MGVTRQAVDKWLLTGPPVERMGKIGVMAGLSDILRYRLFRSADCAAGSLTRTGPPR